MRVLMCAPCPCEALIVLAAAQEIHELLDLDLALARQAIELLEQVLGVTGVYGVLLKQSWR
jgi:hypothetical protein